MVMKSIASPFRMNSKFSLLVDQIGQTLAVSPFWPLRVVIGSELANVLADVLGLAPADGNFPALKDKIPAFGGQRSIQLSYGCNWSPRASREPLSKGAIHARQCIKRAAWFVCRPR